MARFGMNAPSLPATLARGASPAAGLAGFGGCGRVPDALGGTAGRGFTTRGAGGFPNLGGNGRPPTRPANVDRGGPDVGFGDSGQWLDPSLTP